MAYLPLNPLKFLNSFHWAILKLMSSKFLSHLLPAFSSVDEPEKPEDDFSGDVALAPAKPQLKRPPLFRVVLLNDDYTPMEFVVQVLEQYFSMNREQATQVMLSVHTKGKGVCGIYTQDIAETKASQVNECAQVSGHPLLCEVEPAPDEED